MSFGDWGRVTVLEAASGESSHRVYTYVLTCTGIDTCVCIYTNALMVYSVSIFKYLHIHPDRLKCSRYYKTDT